MKVKGLSVASLMISSAIMLSACSGVGEQRPLLLEAEQQIRALKRLRSQQHWMHHIRQRT